MIADKKNVIDPENVQIRVFDSNIQWFDGTRWHTVGTVSEYEAQDPFNEYTGRQSEVPGAQIGDTQDGENGVSSNQDTAYNKRCAGSIVTTTTTNGTGNKGNSNTNKGSSSNNTNKGGSSNTNKGNTSNTTNTANPGNTDTNNDGNTGSNNGGNDNPPQEPSQGPTQTPSTNPDSGTTQDPSNNNSSSDSNDTNHRPTPGEADVNPWSGDVKGA